MDNSPTARVCKVLPVGDGGTGSVVGLIPLPYNVQAIALAAPDKLVAVSGRRIVEVNFNDGGTRDLFVARFDSWQDGDVNSAGLSNLTGVAVMPPAIIVTDSVTGRVKQLWGYRP